MRRATDAKDMPHLGNEKIYIHIYISKEEKVVHRCTFQMVRQLSIKL